MHLSLFYFYVKLCFIDNFFCKEKMEAHNRKFPHSVFMSMSIWSGSDQEKCRLQICWISHFYRLTLCTKSGTLCPKYYSLSPYGHHLTTCRVSLGFSPKVCLVALVTLMNYGPAQLKCVVLPHSRVCPPGSLWITDLIRLVPSISLSSLLITSLSRFAPCVCSPPPFPVTLQPSRMSVEDLLGSSVEQRRRLTGSLYWL